MDMMQRVIKREFEKATDVRVLLVCFTSDEMIVVHTPIDRFVGNDDNGFKFRSDNTGAIVTFPIPEDWDDAIDENNFS